MKMIARAQRTKIREEGLTDYSAAPSAMRKSCNGKGITNAIDSIDLHTPKQPIESFQSNNLRGYPVRRVQDDGLTGISSHCRCWQFASKSAQAG
jgi:hypothetical protein